MEYNMPNQVTEKVFLFQNHNWLYCDKVKYEDGIWTGEVINGYWLMEYDTNNKTLLAKTFNGEVVNSLEVKLLWVGDPYTSSDNYDDVISEAKNRYINGESSNEVIQKIDEEEYSLFLKLYEKYGNPEEDADTIF